MFPPVLRNFIQSKIPKLNPLLANGLAVDRIKGAERYIHETFDETFRPAPQGVTYTGCERCTPREEFKKSVGGDKNKELVDIAVSDLFMMKYNFSFNGEPLQTKFIYLPFVRQAGIIHLSGTKYAITPVLHERVQIMPNAVFVTLIKAKVTFNRISYNYLADNQRIISQVIHSKLYNNLPPNSPSKYIRAVFSNLHYLLCKFGYTEAFRKYVHHVPIIGPASDVNEDNYPDSEWVICKSTRAKPKTYTRKDYEPTNLQIAVRRSHFTPLMKSFIGNLIYIIDHFPHRIDTSMLESTDMWKTLLGHLLWSSEVGEGKLCADVHDHIVSLDEYMDSHAAKDFLDMGYRLTSLYDLLSLTIDKFNDWVVHGQNRVASLYDKDLSILYRTCYDITSAIVNTYFTITKANKRPLEIKKVDEILKKFLKPGMIFKLSGTNHGEVSVKSIVGDNYAVIATHNVTQQAATTKTNKRQGSIKSENQLDASLAEVCSYGFMPKSDPTGRDKLNLFLNISPTGRVLRNEKYIDLLDSIQKNLRPSLTDTINPDSPISYEMVSNVLPEMEIAEVDKSTIESEDD